MRDDLLRQLFVSADVAAGKFTIKFFKYDLLSLFLFRIKSLIPFF